MATKNNANKKLLFEKCTPFIDHISEINNTQINNAKDIDVVMLMYDLIDNRDNHLKNIRTFLVVI